ncbi:hypothetical protein K432DRAFT_298831 [Lepidopterella palustris CBS 459.81]|uniref:Uncharacterized protein n=1 Tax=Lepidopterella palustris CBS 459.81 TaxID=1314670 RepID=A0A8E2E9H9_9PEZI|nr:hypothetical protein K432DRAFT_298831 [Lepidopterella palustris CBS 459.81]
MAVEHSPTAVEIAARLSGGFEALCEEYQLLLGQHRELENKLSWAKQQYLELLKRFTPETVSQDHRLFLQDLEQHAPSPQNAHPRWLEQLEQNEDDRRRYRAYCIRQATTSPKNANGPEGIEDSKIWHGPLVDKTKAHASAWSGSHADSALNMEQDFTTPGTPSRLGCPFATPSGRKLSASGQQSPLATPRSSISRASPLGRRSKRPSFHDPIRAEICGNDPASETASAEGSAAVCPIRFLDQHSPEEVAKYFENHKHEIPRSHEVCVKRFQSNSESIRQLDAKYGSLVSMIQGLGVKHQPWLPEKPEDEVDEPIDERESAEKVKIWAKAVSVSLQDGQTDDAVQAHDQSPEEERTPHFDRQLKEIRVGESPSRPWGISVPAKYNKAVSTSSVKSAATASPLSKSNMNGPAPDTLSKPTGCPFNHSKSQRALPPQTTEPETIHILPEMPTLPSVRPASAPPTEPAAATSEAPKPTPQMVFNGPVFIGYSPDQIMALLQQGGLSAKT